MTGKITGALREQSDWAQQNENRLGFIKNKPFYDTRKTEPLTIEWDGETEGKTSVSFFGATYMKVAETTPTLDEITQGSFTIKNLIEDPIKMQHVLDFSAQLPAVGVFSNEDVNTTPVIFVALEDCEYDGVKIEKGIYSIRGVSDGVSAYVNWLYFPSVTTGELKTIDPKFLPSGGGDIEHIYVHNANGYGLYYAASNTEDNQCVMTLPSEIVSQVKGALERGKALFWHETNDMHGMIEKNSTDILFYNSMQVSVEGITRHMFLVLVPDFTGTGAFAMVGIALTDDENGIMQVQSYGL